MRQLFAAECWCGVFLLVAGLAAAAFVSRGFPSSGRPGPTPSVLASSVSLAIEAEHLASAAGHPQAKVSSSKSHGNVRHAAPHRSVAPVDSPFDNRDLTSDSAASDEEPSPNPDTPRPAFVDDISPAEEANLALGHQMFVHRWRPNDELASGGDGLGPVYNGTSCVECHSQGGLGGAGSNEHSVREFEILPSRAGERVRAGVIHAFATSSQNQETLQSLESYFRPGKVVAGLSGPGSTLLPGATGKVEIEANRYVWINSPALWGLGRIDRLSRAQLEESTDFATHSANAQRLRTTEGRFRLVGDGQIGKFGWKGQFATLRDFVAHACANEIGLSNRTAAQFVPQEFRQDQRARNDLTEVQLAALVRFVGDLPEPKPIMPDDLTHRQMANKGENIVSSIGCTYCHTKNVGDVKDVYSDYQLHKVEETKVASDTYYHQEFQLEVALPASYPALDEWRTPALWGVADTAPYWHDGSVRTLEGAILRHARDAQPVIDSYRRLSHDEQQCVLAFLKTLRAPAVAETPAAKVAMFTP